MHIEHVFKGCHILLIAVTYAKENRSRKTLVKWQGLNEEKIVLEDLKLSIRKGACHRFLGAEAMPLRNLWGDEGFEKQNEKNILFENGHQ